MLVVYSYEIEICGFLPHSLASRSNNCGRKAILRASEPTVIIIIIITTIIIIFFFGGS